MTRTDAEDILREAPPYVGYGSPAGDVKYNALWQLGHWPAKWSKR